MVVSVSCWMSVRSLGTCCRPGRCSHSPPSTGTSCSLMTRSRTCFRRVGAGRRSRRKAACGFGRTETSFHPTVLTYWRPRLAGSTRPHRIFEAVSEVIAQSGALSGRKRWALDSTILDDAVARQDAVTQLVAQIRRVGREVPGADLIVAGLRGHDYEKLGKPDIAWDDKAARDEFVSRLVTDALALLAVIDTTSLTDPQQDTVALLALVAGQDVEPAGARMAPMGGGGLRGRLPRTGLSRLLILMPATLTRAGRRSNTVSKPTWRSSPTAVW